MNFKHLHYFWVTAKAGGVMRAGEQLHTTPQTLSGQIKLLEDWLGRKLFKKSGRHLELTEDGRLALGYADQIFSLGIELEEAVRQHRGAQKVLDFKVGVADSATLVRGKDKHGNFAHEQRPRHDLDDDALAAHADAVNRQVANLYKGTDKAEFRA